MTDQEAKLTYRKQGVLRELKILSQDLDQVIKKLTAWDMTSDEWHGLNSFGSFQNITKTEAQLSGLIAAWEMIHGRGI